MNKQEFSDELAERCDLSKAAGGRVLDAILESVTEALADRDEVALPGFGKFAAQKRRGREGTDPRNPDRRIRIAPGYVPKFRPGSRLRDAVHASAPPHENGAAAPDAPAAAAGIRDLGSERGSNGGAAQPSATSRAQSSSSGAWRPLSQR
jgi:DNA-binding protein HU-beta